jgi:hypothetical protein
MQILLIGHILSALVLWAGSFYGFRLAARSNDNEKLRQTLRGLLSALLITTVLGLFTALSFGDGVSFAVCGQLALYLSPAFIALYQVRRKMSNMQAKPEANE